ncbi:methyltransferase family protein [Kistimonas asteriae]|uniref:methyltransferase family protein n=1 Tax=Kistimonas asteriae TaxID=517724 RepID=UPI001BAB0B40|nr:isoprenylcysteine carboxylmethyltransferase family protein [Kistimonas asteriae]
MKSSLFAVAFFFSFFFLFKLLDVNHPIIPVVLLFSAFLGYIVSESISLKQLFKVRKHEFSAQRIKYKFFSASVILLVIPIYSYLGTMVGFTWLQSFWNDLWLFSFLLILVPLYIVFSDVRQNDPYDEYFYVGRFLATGITAGKWVNHFYRALLVKAFFLPLMYGFYIIAVNDLLGWRLDDVMSSKIFQYLFVLGLTIDVLIGTLGYVLSLKLFNTDIKSVDSTLSGWLVCLLCYPPFNQHVTNVLHQQDNLYWTDIFSPESPIYWVWGIFVVLSWGIYWWATLSMGVRFSNLTYRGVISSGPYRWMKHPAYFSKNVYWWLITIPFVTVGGWFSIYVNVMALIMWNLIYYARAKTEERHLRKYVEYREYCSFVDRNGLLAVIGNALSRLKGKYIRKKGVLNRIYQE